MLKTPKFWYKKQGIISSLLTPLSWLYFLGHIINQKTQNSPYKPSIPVICVGNAVAGGSGKTPTVIALTKIIKEYDIAQNPFIVSRGYGSDIIIPTLVAPHNHTADDVGDEALLLAQYAPTIICPNRAAAAKMAEQEGADIIIMDDGLQNNHLQKTLSLLCIDRQIDFGNNKLIPAGPLREPIKDVLKKTDFIVCIGRPMQAEKPLFASQIKPNNIIDPTKKYIAFAGIGLPEKFKNTLLDLEANLVGWIPFPDHYKFSKSDISKMKDKARDLNASLITTEKDYVRLPNDLRENIETLTITLEFDEPAHISAFIKDTLRSRA